MLLSVSRRQTEARANAGKAQEGPGALHWQLLALRGDSSGVHHDVRYVRAARAGLVKFKLPK